MYGDPVAGLTIKAPVLSSAGTARMITKLLLLVFQPPTGALTSIIEFVCLTPLPYRMFSTVARIRFWPLKVISTNRLVRFMVIIKLVTTLRKTTPMAAPTAIEILASTSVKPRCAAAGWLLSNTKLSHVGSIVMGGHIALFVITDAQVNLFNTRCRSRYNHSGVPGVR